MSEPKPAPSNSSILNLFLLYTVEVHFLESGTLRACWRFLNRKVGKFANYSHRYADDENAVMRKACKLLNVGIAQLESQTVKEPFFDHVIGAATEKIAFRYLAGLIRRCTDQAGGKMMTDEVRSI